MTSKALTGAPTEVNVAPDLFSLHLAEYLADLSDMDLSEAQKVELLQVLWSIMARFVQMGFSLDLCGQLVQRFNLMSMQTGDQIESQRAIPEEEAEDEEQA